MNIKEKIRQVVLDRAIDKINRNCGRIAKCGWQSMADQIRTCLAYMADSEAGSRRRESQETELMSPSGATEAHPPAADRLDLEWAEFVKLLHGMATDDLMRKGPTKRAFVGNLRIIANRMETLIPNNV